VNFVASQSPLLAAANLKELKLSTNEGESWKSIPLPKDLTQIGTMTLDDQSTLWVGGREGLFHSKDFGATWEQVPNLLLSDVDAVYFDPASDRMLVTTAQSTFVFAVQLPSYKVSYWNTGWKLRFARPVGDHLVAATLFDGVVVQPQMVDSAVGPTVLKGSPAPSSANASKPPSTTTAKP
jgi:ligand-binding sensor domain-containing protein